MERCTGSVRSSQTVSTSRRGPMVRFLPAPPLIDHRISHGRVVPLPSMTTTVHIPGLHCDSCESLVKQVSHDYPLIRSIDVDFVSPSDSRREPRLCISSGQKESSVNACIGLDISTATIGPAKVMSPHFRNTAIDSAVISLKPTNIFGFRLMRR